MNLSIRCHAATAGELHHVLDRLLEVVPPDTPLTWVPEGGLAVEILTELPTTPTLAAVPPTPPPAGRGKPAGRAAAPPAKPTSRTELEANATRTPRAPAGATAMTRQKRLHLVADTVNDCRRYGNPITPALEAAGIPKGSHSHLIRAAETAGYITVPPPGVTTPIDRHPIDHDKVRAAAGEGIGL